MANRTYQKAFAGGEISDLMYGRLDDAKYQQGAALMRNFIATPQGPAENRAGFAFVRATKNNAAARLLSFTYSSNQTMVIELGAGYFRFHTMGATLLDAGVPYEVENDYAAEDLAEIRFAQSADVLTLVHPNYPPAELKRLGALSWTFTNITFGPAIATPGGVGVVDSPGFKILLTGVSYADPAVFTTSVPHTLGVGSSVYVRDLTVTTGGGPFVMDDYYIVATAPSDTTFTLLRWIGESVNGGGWSGWSAGAAVEPSNKAYDQTGHYVVTAIGENGVDESAISAEVSVLNNLNVTGAYNTISWAGVTGALRYHVYKKRNGLYGYIGETSALSFVDDNIAPDLSMTPPNFTTVFNAAGEYPGAVSYYEQRRVFGGTAHEPQSVWMTRSGTESDMSYSLPVKDTDRVSFRVAAREANTIRHIIPLTSLVLLTAEGEWRVAPVNSDAITPTTIGVKPQSYIGASYVTPSLINNTLVYCAARGGHVREMGYNWQSNGFVTGDLSLRASHLFDNLELVDQTYAKAPRPLVWFVSSSGKLLGLTYIPEEQVGAWHQHTTDGAFEAVACVAEGKEDRLYAIVRRTVNGQTVRYIERLASRVIDPADYRTWFFVDAGATYDGAPATTISGLGHLEGKAVAILGDGAVFPAQTVVGGAITLPVACSVVHVGLGYASDLGALPATLAIDGYGQGRQKNVNKGWVRVSQTRGLLIGPDAQHLTEAPPRSTETYGTPPALKTDVIEVLNTPSWTSGGQVLIRQANPLPLTVVSLTLEVSTGG